MAYQFETIKLEKGMYHEGGRSFAQVLEKLDPASSTRALLWRVWTPSSVSSNVLTSR